MAFTALVFAPAWALDAAQFGAWAAALQAVGVVAALVFAGQQVRQGSSALKQETYDKRVDRVFALSQELTTGPINDARRRLNRHLAGLGAGRSVRRLSRHDLRSAPYNIYADPESAKVSTPWDDAGLLLRFFERALVVQVSQSADDPVFVEMIGRHAAWWNCAIKDDTSKTRKSLMSLGTWADKSALALSKDFCYLAGWGDTRNEQFGSIRPWELDLPG